MGAGLVAVCRLASVHGSIPGRRAYATRASKHPVTAGGNCSLW